MTNALRAWFPLHPQVLHETGRLKERQLAKRQASEDQYSYLKVPDTALLRDHIMVTNLTEGHLF